MRLVVKFNARQNRKETAEPDPTPNPQTDQSEVSGDEGPGIDELFEHLRGKLIFFFAAKQCDDPEELAQITLMRVVKRLDDGEEVSDLTRYTFGVAKHIRQEYWRGDKWILESIDAQKHQFAVEPSVNENDADIRERMLTCLEECMARLKEQDRTMLLEYYQFKGEHRRKMAERLNITREALTLRIYHLKQRLKKCMSARLENM